jgi:hypothetical protein
VEVNPEKVTQNLIVFQVPRLYFILTRQQTPQCTTFHWSIRAGPHHLSGAAAATAQIGQAIRFHPIQNNNAESPAPKLIVADPAEPSGGVRQSRKLLSGHFEVPQKVCFLATRC